MKKPADISKFNLRLRKEVEEKMGARVNTPKDFVCLHDRIYKELHVSISISTLKRYWGYVSAPTHYQPNIFTLNTLTHFVGYRDWEAFIAGDKKKATPGKTERRKKIEAALSRIESQMARLGEEVATLHRLMHEEE